MRDLSQISDLLDFLSQDNHWKLVLKNNSGFYNFKDIHEELFNLTNDYHRYFRIYINHPNTSIFVHRIYCPDKKFGPSGVIEPSDNGIWLGYFKLPDSQNENFQEQIGNLQNQIQNIVLKNEIQNNPFLHFILLKLVSSVLLNTIWPNPSQITLKTCSRCWSVQQKSKTFV